MPCTESALVVLVPEAEALVKPFRDRYDPSAAAGMPAHITLLYPFKSPDELDDAVLADLRHCFARFAPIRYALASTRRFPVDVLYLAPEPDEPFRRLTLAIWERYPDTPPYGGKWPDIIPMSPWQALPTNNTSGASPMNLRRRREASCRSTQQRQRLP
jgi:hypothetical protein